VDGNEVVMDKLLIKPVGMTMTMRADCPSCKRKIVESRYESTHEYNLKRDKWRDNIRSCPYCECQFRGKPTAKQSKVVWTSFKGGVGARAKNGEFTVTKCGRRWIWTFQYYSENETRAENQGGAFSKEVAQRVCEKHKEWMV
jgi:hypothetical protein